MINAAEINKSIYLDYPCFFSNLIEPIMFSLRSSISLKKKLMPIFQDTLKSSSILFA